MCRFFYLIIIVAGLASCGTEREVQNDEPLTPTTIVQTPEHGVVQIVQNQIDIRGAGVTVGTYIDRDILGCIIDIAANVKTYLQPAFNFEDYVASNTLAITWGADTAEAGAGNINVARDTDLAMTLALASGLSSYLGITGIDRDRVLAASQYCIATHTQIDDAMVLIDDAKNLDSAKIECVIASTQKTFSAMRLSTNSLIIEWGRLSYTDSDLIYDHGWAYAFYDSDAVVQYTYLAMSIIAYYEQIVNGFSAIRYHSDFSALQRDAAAKIADYCVAP